MIKFYLAALPIAAALAVASSPASATITITANQQDGQGDNVLFQDVEQTGPAGTVTGETQDGYSLLFSSTTGQTLFAPAKGQARVEAEGGDLTSVVIKPSTVGQYFDFIEFNLNGADSPFTINACDNFGDCSFSYSSDGKSGSNFVFASTDAAQSIASISFTGSATDIRQIRPGFEETAVGAVPEPATWAMMLFGFGAVGFGMRRRRGQKQGQTRVRFA
ncbi:PEPxxWA-CTERM sorting domain-containing protein [Parafrankia sp. BMG5.11]|uniref:PEPxxWA-CTERM sorting domain-containing protein n=1 Tax=Parafrankia sp. BMG5.11 TaxID=222540 RepID=UPI00103E0638|nr:PEPxxWA-CTERM sorting domain-containing protein [Parafrankia sp. BMG5.11]TCJ39513.1 PEP-CTERM sorting domain-containing protein [Parafrankia sp. BMG5.11]